MNFKYWIFIACIISYVTAVGQSDYRVIAYYSGDSTSLQAYQFDKLTHLIYGFGHVDKGDFVINSPKDISALHAFQALKKQHQHLKTMISLGGWGGCESCSKTFNNEALTDKFVASVKQFLTKYDLDGIDLDWEYPVIEGFPGHQYSPKDKQNFTRLVKKLRHALGAKKIISFAAGGTMEYLTMSINWQAVTPYIDFVNLMSYDLVNGNSTRSGHSTPLYSAYEGEPSVDFGITYFKKIKFPLRKIIIGAAFYTREFKVADISSGIYQPAKFINAIPYKDGIKIYTPANGFVSYWDDKAKAPYWYNFAKQIFVTGDDPRSISLKCDYVKENQLGGIMFWELFADPPRGGLYDALSLPIQP